MSKTDVYSYPPDKNSIFSGIISQHQKGLIDEGFMLLDNIKKHLMREFVDYSYLVFPFAKA